MKERHTAKIELREPPPWRRQLWMEYFLCIAVFFAVTYVIFWIMDHVVKRNG